MPCYAPLRAHSAPGPDGKARIRFRFFLGSTPVELNCGQCIGCRVDRVADWTARIMHEASLHPVSQFVTLTYDDSNNHGSLCKRDLQLFWKRLRDKYGALRYFACGEYGERTWRPHYHAVIFGLILTDLKRYKETAGGQLYTSPSLEKLWDMGLVVVGPVTRESAAYVAGYINKKLTGPQAEVYVRVDKDTGELTRLVPPFAVMSRRPGIGAEWLDRYATDIYPRDQVVVGGKVIGNAPKFYDARHAVKQPELIEAVKARRKAYALEPRQAANSTRARLKVRETVTEARLSLRKRDVNGS